MERGRRLQQQSVCCLSVAASANKIQTIMSTILCHRYSYHTGEKSPSGKAEDRDYTQLVEILLKMRDIIAFVDVNETGGVPYARPFDVAVRQGVIGCKVGVVVLTDLFVGKQWPVFEWFLFEARTVVDPSFRLLYDVCVHDDQVRWFQLGWPNGTRWFEGKIK